MRQLRNNSIIQISPVNLRDLISALCFSLIMVIREEQERVRTLLCDTITLLCRNGLSFKTEFNISAVIGITLDKEDVFLVDIRETIKSANGEASDSGESEKRDSETPSRKSRKRRKRSHSAEDRVNSDSDAEALNSGNKDDAVQERLEVKSEVMTENDDENLVFIKNEPGIFNPSLSDTYSLSGTYSLPGNQNQLDTSGLPVQGNPNQLNTSGLQLPTPQQYQDSGGQWSAPALPTFDPATPSTSSSLQQSNIEASVAQVGIFCYLIIDKY